MTKPERSLIRRLQKGKRFKPSTEHPEGNTFDVSTVLLSRVDTYLNNHNLNNSSFDWQVSPMTCLWYSTVNNMAISEESNMNELFLVKSMTELCIEADYYAFCVHYNLPQIWVHFRLVHIFMKTIVISQETILSNHQISWFMISIQCLKIHVIKKP